MASLFTGRGLIAALAASFVAFALPAQISLQGNSVRQRQSAPGETYSGTFMVVNDSKQPQEARLYQTDYFASADGTNLYGAPGSSPRSNAQWVGITSSRLVIPPESSREVTFTVAVPAGRPLLGTYWSMVMVEGVSRESPESTLPSTTTRKSVQTAVLTRIRYAVQIVTHLGAESAPEVKFEAPSVRVTKEGTKVLQLDVLNPGLRSFIPTFTLELYAQDGTHVKTASASREIVYPGTSLRQQFDLGMLPAGTYRALVTLDAGGSAVFGAQYTLKL